MKGFRIGIPEQQLKPHALRARGTVADIYTPHSPTPQELCPALRGRHWCGVGVGVKPPHKQWWGGTGGGWGGVGGYQKSTKNARAAERKTSQTCLAPRPNARRDEISRSGASHFDLPLSLSLGLFQTERCRCRCRCRCKNMCRCRQMHMYRCTFNAAGPQFLISGPGPAQCGCANPITPISNPPGPVQILLF